MKLRQVPTSQRRPSFQTKEQASMSLGHMNLSQRTGVGWQKGCTGPRHHMGSSVVQGPSRSPTSRLPKVLVAPGDGTGSTTGKTWLRTKSL